MKKLSYLLSIGAAALLASCSSEGLVNEPKAPEADGQAPMAFETYRANQSRANVGLETEVAAFGVYAIKAANQEGITYDGNPAANLVMKDYLVGYWDGTNGYTAWGNANTHDGYTTADPTKWYYEALNATNSAAWFTPGALFADGQKMVSRNDNQYLKYWDAAVANTYFYMFAPYTRANGAAGATFSVADGKSKLTFGAIEGQAIWNEHNPAPSVVGQYDYMYAFNKCTNATMISNKDRVRPVFNHLMAKIRMTFTEAVPGYTVEVEPFQLGQTTYPAADGKYASVYLVPTLQDGTGYTTTDAQYLNKGDVTVTVDEITVATAYANGKYGTAPIVHPYNWWASAADGAASTQTLIPDAGNKIYGDWFTVVPADQTTPNCGFTLNVSLKFTAEDTGEVFRVWGAKAFVPAADCQWEPNKAYIYNFKITTGVTGNTGTPEPTPGKYDPTKALWPIIFDNVQVTDYETALDKEYSVN